VNYRLPAASITRRREDCNIWLPQPAAPNKQVKRRPTTKTTWTPSGKSRPFITSTRIRKGLEGSEGTKPYNTRATITKQIRRNRSTWNDTTKYDGGYSRTRRSNILANYTDAKSRTNDINPGISKRRNQKAKSKGTAGLLRGATQTQRLATKLIGYYRTVGW